MTRNLMMSRRNVLASGLALGVSAFAPAVRAAPIKVAGIHASPVENAWNSVLHKALQDAAAEGAIEYVFSEGVSGTDYPPRDARICRAGRKTHHRRSLCC